MLKRISSFALGCLFLSQTMAFAATDTNISGLFEKGQVIKVFIKEVTNTSENKNVSADIFKAEVEKAMANRKSVSFKVVPSADQSDIQVSGVIKLYQYMERGPLKPTLSLETAAIDAVATSTQNYADMNVAFTIVDTKTGKTLWQGDVYDYLKKTMTEQESLPLIYDKVARKFVVKSFGKAKKK